MTTKPFWQARSLAELSEREWESLCDGCGLCCLRKLEAPDSGQIAYTDVACHLLDCDSCRCRNYEKRTELVADCVKLRPGDREQLSWMPSTCAYRLLDAGKPLPEWHPLISGTTQSVRDAGISVSGRCVSEEFVHEDEIEFRIVDWVTTEA
ncbi:MAG TPA: YcgN family cysteine cluster protein [Gammaproteobacteria bacterium]